MCKRILLKHGISILVFTYQKGHVIISRAKKINQSNYQRNQITNGFITKRH